MLFLCPNAQLTDFSTRIGGFITKSYLGWRWTQYIPSFMAFTCAILALFFLDESYPPIILVSKASELRRLTRNWVSIPIQA
jgi:DHA1 family multidrug resistance protein-like MFS transporter